MEARSKGWTLVAVAVVALLAVGGLRGLRSVEAAPDFTLPTTGLEEVGGDPFADPDTATRGTWSLAEHRNRTVVLDFMAVSCTTCRVVTADVLLPLWERYGHRADFAIVSVDAWADPLEWQGLGETMEELARLQQEERLPWPHALDIEKVYRAYSAAALPKLVVVDGDGRIVYEKQGSQDLGAVEAAVLRSLDGAGEPAAVLRVGWIGLGALAGVAAFFAPCCVGLLPAYLGLLLRQRQASPLGGGLAAAAGMVAAYAAIALLLVAAAAAGWGPRLRSGLPWLAPAVGVSMVLVGAAGLAGWSWPAWRGANALAAAGGDAGGQASRRGLVGFGAAYAAAGFACTGPLLLPVLLGASLDGWQVGLSTMAAYTAVVAGLAVAIAAAVAAGAGARLRALAQGGRKVQVVSGALFVAAGAWIAAYGLRPLL